MVRKKCTAWLANGRYQKVHVYRNHLSSGDFQRIMHTCPISSYGWQGRSGNTLADCFKMVVSGVKSNRRDLRKLCFQNFFGRRHHEVASRALAHTAENHYIVDL